MKPETFQAACDYAVAQYPLEACGVVLSDKRREWFVPITNISGDKENQFVMDPTEFDAAQEQGEVICIFHSHPDCAARPTPGDLAGCENTGVAWAIVAVHGDPAHPLEKPVVVDSCEFVPSGYEMPYRGREFRMGTVDCYTLVQDYYKRELEIELPYFPRTDLFWERGENLYTDNFAACGFDEIALPEQPGDLILMAIRSDVVNHAGIWLGEQNHMLHHPYMHLSEKTIYGGYWAENQRLFIRKVR